MRQNPTCWITIWSQQPVWLSRLAVLVTHLHSNAPQISVETGRKMAPSEHMPSFAELEEAVQAVQV